MCVHAYVYECVCRHSPLHVLLLVSLGEGCVCMYMFMSVDSSKIGLLGVHSAHSPLHVLLLVGRGDEVGLLVVVSHLDEQKK